MLFIGANIPGIQQYPEYFTAPGILCILFYLFLEERCWPSKVGWVNGLVGRLLKACEMCFLGYPSGGKSQWLTSPGESCRFCF